jgi:hypothetical protein
LPTFSKHNSNAQNSSPGHHATLKPFHINNYITLSYQGFRKLGTGQLQTCLTPSSLFWHLCFVVESALENSCKITSSGASWSLVLMMQVGRHIDEEYPDL